MSNNILGYLVLNMYAFLIILSLLIIFFSKKRLKHFEDLTYGKFLIASVSISFTGLLTGILISPNLNTPEFVLIIFNKLYLISLLMWLNYLTLYTLYISIKNKKRFDKVNDIFKFLNIIYVLLIIILPLKTELVNGNAMPSGLAMLFTSLVFCLSFLLQIICILFNIKNLLNKKFIPVYILITFGSAVVVNQTIHPEMNYLLNPLFIFIAYVMYHTIENPDVKQLNEIARNNEIVEQTYIDKSNFLFEMTGEIREPLRNVRNTVNNLKNTKNINDIKLGLNSIDNSIRQLDFTVNDVLNVNSLDVQKVKIIDNRYNLKNLFDDMVKRIKPEINENVEFRYNIPNNIPYLYGDNIKLKQILYSLLMNAVKKTESGFIEFNVNTIEKYDVCRVIFSIIDSGVGIGIDKINEILSITGELSQQDIVNLEKSDFNLELCKKIIESLGGNLLIKSKIGKGTEIILTLDQKVYRNPDNENNIYQSNNKRVLLVIQDKKITSNIKKMLTSNNISVSHILYGMDAIDRIKSGKKYDYIILEDDMKEMSGYETLQSLKRLSKFNIPCIILLSEDKVNIKEQYLKDGFKDYILISDLQDEVNRIIKKY